VGAPDRRAPLIMLKSSVQLDPAVLLLASYGRRCRDDRPCVAAEQTIGASAATHNYDLGERYRQVASRFTLFRVVSRSQIQYFRSSRRLCAWFDSRQLH
jgi:hypothetical protein